MFCFFITRPDLRNSGIGFSVGQKALEACKVKTFCGYGLLHMKKYYEKKFDCVAVDRHVWYIGVPSLDAGLQSAIHDGIVRINSASLDAVYSYNRKIFPVERTTFWSAWLSPPQHIGYVAVENGQVTGYGMIRPCHGEVNRIGALYAGDAETAEHLFHVLVADSGVKRPVMVSVPEPNRNDAKLCRQYGLEPGEIMWRMVRGPLVSFPLNKIFGALFG